MTASRVSPSAEVVDRAAKVRLLIFDVDGVLTDGSLYFDHDGREYKAFHSRDGHGMKMLRENGVEVAIITARRSQAVAHRAANLGLEHVYQGQQEKRVAYAQLIHKLGLHHTEVGYVGDDIVDLPVMVQVGLAIAVADAHPEVIARAHWRTQQPGGRGAARDACELIMKARGVWDTAIAKYTCTE